MFNENDYQTLHQGRRKNVLSYSKETLLLHTTAKTTGRWHSYPDGTQTFEPGMGEELGPDLDALDAKNLRISDWLFTKLNDAGIPTHYLASNTAQNIMQVHAAFIPQGGLKTSLTVGEEQKKPLKFERSNLGAAKEIPGNEDMVPIVEAQLEKIALQSAGIIQEVLLGHDLELTALELEFGLIQGQLAVVDEVSAHNMTVKEKGSSLPEEQLADKLEAIAHQEKLLQHFLNSSLTNNCCF